MVNPMPDALPSLADRTQVYVLESGEYSQRGIAGIYDTLERAMASEPGRWTRTVWQWRPHWHEQWSLEDSSCEITAYEVMADGPTAERPLTATVQRFEAPPWRARHQGWDYIEVSAAEADAIIEGQSDPGDIHAPQQIGETA